jgi:hypothetical protein
MKQLIKKSTYLSPAYAGNFGYWVFPHNRELRARPGDAVPQLRRDARHMLVAVRGGAAVHEIALAAPFRGTRVPAIRLQILSVMFKHSPYAR